jgi:hypothetical protein
MGGYSPVPVGQPAGMGGYNPVPVGQPAQPPFLASQTAARMGRPIEPFDEAVRLVLLGFGVLLLIAFFTPVSTGPVSFHWSAILHAPGKAKIAPLMIAACGVLGIVVAFLPLAYAVRAAIAAVVGFTPILLGIALGGSIEWRGLLAVVGVLTLLPGLLMRQEYRHHVLPRVLVTVGAIAILLPMLLPVGGTVPLVGLFKAIGSVPGKGKIAALFNLVPLLLVIASLIAWLPAPSSAGAKALAWTLLLWDIVDHYVDLLLQGGIGGAIKAAPFSALLGPIPHVAYVAFVAYGLAAVIGKQLETR